MSLHDTDALVVEASTAAESLPDPTTVSGRTHDLTNTALVTAVWTSTGATPFQVDGVNLASLSVGAGGRARVQSDGTHWVLVRSNGSRASFAGTATTDANGIATFAFAAGLFPAAPVVAATVQSATGTNGHFCEVSAVTATSCTVQVWQGRSIVVGLQTTITSGSGITVHLIATPAGSAS